MCDFSPILQHSADVLHLSDSVCRCAGYTGFVPESDHNALACNEASAEGQPRRDDKPSTMLFGMDQYSRQRVPHYTGHRARALGNLSVTEPAQGPTVQTTQVISLPLHLSGSSVLWPSPKHE